MLKFLKGLLERVLKNQCIIRITMVVEMILQNSVYMLIISVVAFLLSFTIHEFSHALVSYKFGDSTAKDMGRVTLNPIAHLDPVGTLLPILLILTRSPIVFGWGKPVPLNPGNLKNQRKGVALISLAGPLSNILLAILASLFITLGIFKPLNMVGAFMYLLAYHVALYSLVLGFFNLIPLGPLDGNKVVFGFLPNNLAIQWVEIQKYGTFLLLFLILFNFTEKILLPLVDISMKLLGL